MLQMVRRPHAGTGVDEPVAPGCGASVLGVLAIRVWAEAAAAVVRKAIVATAAA